jgi:putative ABC transport system substrate-binding protein
MTQPPSPLTMLLSRHTRRREFITLLGGAAAAWPFAARAQQPAKPLVGVLGIGSPESNAMQLASFRNGLSEQGYAEGQNAVIESRFAETGQYDRLVSLASDLARLPVTVLVAIGTAGVARAAKAATTTIPIVFANGSDPVLLRELVPQATTIAFLVNPTNPVTEGDTKEIEDAARNIGQRMIVIRAKNESEIDTAFATIAREGAGSLLINVDGFFSTRRNQLAALAAHYRIPTSYNNRVYVEAGGLMSYGDNRLDSYRQLGVYVGRILKGDKPADLPVMQPTKFELVINLKTAKALGLEVPPTLLARADEVIE